MRFAPRALAALALVAALALPARAQFLPSFGVTAGANFSSLTDAGSLDLDNSTGFHVGVFADLGIGPLALRPAVLYQRVGEVDFTPAGVANLDSEDLSFIAVPIDLKFGFPSPLVKPYALVGPEFRFPTGGITDIEGFDTKSVNTAINVGAGAELSALIGPKVFAELRYAFDVSGLADSELGTVSDANLKVNLFMIRIGVGL